MLSAVFTILVLLALFALLMFLVGAWRPFKNWAREKGEQVGDQFKDPVRDGKFAIRDSKVAVAKFRQDIARFVANNKSVERQLNNARMDVAKWQQIVTQAQQAGAGEDVSKAEQQLSNAKRQAVEFKKQFDANDVAIQKLRQQLEAADRKITDAESTHVQLSARQRGAEIRQSLASTSDSFGQMDSPLAHLDELRDAVEAAEDQASAMEETSTSTADDLASKYAVASHEVDSEYDRLFK